MTRTPSTHEDLSRQHVTEGSSDRSFGLVFAAVGLLLGLWPLVGGRPVRAWALVVGAVFLLLALLRPTALGPANRLWIRLGLVLHRVMSAFVLGVIYYLTVTPMGVAMRLLGRDPLRRRFDSQARSYWIERRPPGPAPRTMRNQF